MFKLRKEIQEQDQRILLLEKRLEDYRKEAKVRIAAAVEKLKEEMEQEIRKQIKHTKKKSDKNEL